MLWLKATESNWGLSGPGDWDERIWRIDTDGKWKLKITYRPGFDGMERTEEMTGAFSAKKMEALRRLIRSEWSCERSYACDVEDWDFKLYEKGIVIRHREEGYIYGIKPFEGIAKLLSEAEGKDKGNI